MNSNRRQADIRDSIRILLSLAAGIRPALLPEHLPDALALLTESDTRYWNRLIIPIYATIKLDHGISVIPLRLRADIQKKFMELLAIQVRQRYWLERLAGIVKNAQLPVILLKGAAATGTIYDQRYVRVSQDIDLFVHKRDSKELVRIINQIAAPRPQNRHRVFSERYSHEHNFPIDTGMPFNIEPHIDLNPRYSFKVDNDDLWRHSMEHPLFNSQYIRILSDEHTLVYMATHSFFHLEFEPHHLVDAIRLIIRRVPDLHTAFAYSKSWGCSAILHLLFDQLQAWFDWSSGLPRSNTVQRRLVTHGECIRQPMCPLTDHVPFRDQVRSMMLHDSKIRVLLFSSWFLFKRMMDRILKWCNSVVAKTR
ncbi:nucleotidyltransferase family protein [bacterium]|nr:nucleotidyltransferase family protein [candidate division CSSED10-310 bacterium]